MTPLERAARAIAEYYCEDPDEIDNVPGLAHKRLARWRRYVPVAAAVLTAIREPSEAMIPEDGVFAGFFHDADGVEDNNYITPDEARWAWKAMIDAILM